MNEVSDSPVPELSLTLVLVLKCLTLAHLVCPPTIAHITRQIKFIYHHQPPIHSIHLNARKITISNILAKADAVFLLNGRLGAQKLTSFIQTPNSGSVLRCKKVSTMRPRSH